MSQIQAVTVHAYNKSSTAATIVVAHRVDGILRPDLLPQPTGIRSWRTPESTVYMADSIPAFVSGPNPPSMFFNVNYEGGSGARMDYWYVLAVFNNWPTVSWSLGGNTLRPSIAMKIPDDGQINIEISNGPGLAVYPGPMSSSVVGVPMAVVADTYEPAERKSVAALTNDERKEYVDAVLKLKKAPSRLNPPTDNRYNDYVLLHMLAMGDVRVKPGVKVIDSDAITSVVTRAPMQMWAHQGPQFTAWHREYLYQFELDLFRVSGRRLGIPYWDWTVDSAKDGVPWLADFMGKDDGEGPFAGKKWPLTLSSDPVERKKKVLVRGLGSVVETLPTAKNVSDTLSALLYDASPFSSDPSLASFRNMLEGWHVPDGQSLPGMHNRVHDWVGGESGTMLYGSSPNDPVFFLHHANIDRLWAIWQEAHPDKDAYLPLKPEEGSEALAIDQPMTFQDPAVMKKFPWSGSPATPRQVIHHHDLNYFYDTDMTPAALGRMAPLEGHSIPRLGELFARPPAQIPATGPRRLTRDHFQIVADLHRQALAEAPEAPIAWMRRIGAGLHPDLARSASTWRRWVRQARELSLIAPSG
ncbi:MAG: tyrosinase family protein [Acidimicrobiales bacterium]